MLICCTQLPHLVRDLPEMSVTTQASKLSFEGSIKCASCCKELPVWLLNYTADVLISASGGV